MKTRILLYILPWMAVPVWATGIPVVDAAHIAVNEISHTIDYVEQVLHEANQQTQIAKQVEQIEQLYTQIEQLYQQIEQMDTYLERFGDPKSILNLSGVDDLLGELKSTTKGLDMETKLKSLTGQSMFQFDGEGVFQPIGDTYQVGEKEVEREAERYKPEDATRETVQQYRDKKAEVLERRDAMKADIADVTEQLRQASTDSEVQKLSGVLVGMQTQLQAVDKELDMATQEAAVRELENANQRRAEAKAATERDARRFSEANRQDVKTYRLDTSSYGW